MLNYHTGHLINYVYKHHPYKSILRSTKLIFILDNIKCLIFRHFSDWSHSLIIMSIRVKDLNLISGEDTVTVILWTLPYNGITQGEDTSRRWQPYTGIEQRFLLGLALRYHPGIQASSKICILSHEPLFIATVVTYQCN